MVQQQGLVKLGLAQLDLVMVQAQQGLAKLGLVQLDLVKVQVRYLIVLEILVLV